MRVRRRLFSYPPLHLLGCTTDQTAPTANAFKRTALFPPASSIGCCAGSDFSDALRLLRQEREAAEINLQLSEREVARLRQETAVAKRGAEEARAQLSAEAERVRSSVRAEQDQAALMQKLEQFNLLRESNATLRADNGRAQRQIRELQQKVRTGEAAQAPLQQRIRTLEAERNSAGQELAAVREQQERWQKRAQQLMQKYESVDQQEYQRVTEELKQARDKAVAAERAAADKAAEVESLQQQLAAEQARLAAAQKKLEEGEKENAAAVASLNEELGKAKVGWYGRGVAVGLGLGGWPTVAPALASGSGIWLCCSSCGGAWVGADRQGSIVGNGWWQASCCLCSRVVFREACRCEWHLSRAGPAALMSSGAVLTGEPHPSHSLRRAAQADSDKVRRMHSQLVNMIQTNFNKEKKPLSQWKEAQLAKERRLVELEEQVKALQAQGQAAVAGGEAAPSPELAAEAAGLRAQVAQLEANLKARDENLEKHKKAEEAAKKSALQFGGWLRLPAGCENRSCPILFDLLSAPMCTCIVSQRPPLLL